MIRVKHYNVCPHVGEHNPKLCLPSKPIEGDFSKGFGAILFDKMKSSEGKIFQVHADTGEQQTFDYVLKRAIRIAEAIKARGVTPEDTVAFCSGNNMDIYVVFLACAFLCVKMAAFDPSYSQRNTVRLSNLVKPKLVFCDKKGESLFESIRSQINHEIEIIIFENTKVGNNTPITHLTQYPADVDSFVPTPVRNLEDVFSILFTSGTTGYPKAVCLSHECQIRSVINNAAMNNTILALSNLYWISATINISCAVIKGGKLVLVSNTEISNIIRTIQEHQVYSFICSPYFMRQISKAKTDFHDLSCVKSVVVGGSIVTKTDVLAFREALPEVKVLHCYGQTEFAGQVLGVRPDSDLDMIMEKPESCGRVVPGTCVKIVDVNTGNTCGPYQPGEMRVKTDRTFNGYYGLPEDSDACFDEEGYFCTGDILYYDEDYCFYFVTRISDKMKFRGVFVHPGHVEDELLQHEDVEDAAAFGIAHEEDGDLPAAVVVLRDGAKVDAKELLNFIKERMPDSNRLRGGLGIVDKIARNLSGKVQRKLYPDMVSQGNLFLTVDNQAILNEE